MDSYQATTKLDSNVWITDAEIPDPDNLPIPLGWCLLVRPYKITQDTQKSSLIIPTESVEYMNYVTNIGRVVSIGSSCFTRPEHRNQAGEQEPWVQVGDFVSYPKNVGARRKFKGVSYVLLVDDELVEKLPDPQVFDNSVWRIDIPEDHLKKYNTIHNPEYKG